jgi:hypothetical protein
MWGSSTSMVLTWREGATYAPNATHGSHLLDDEGAADAAVV